MSAAVAVDYRHVDRNLTGIEPIRKKVPWWVGKALNDDTPFRKFHVTKGLGAGGSYGAAIWHLTLALKFNVGKQTSWVVAPTYAQIEDPCITTMVEVLETVFEMEEGKDYQLNISGRPKIILQNGHTISFRSAANPKNLVGSNVSHIWVTEPGLLKEEAFQKLVGRMRSPKSNRLQWMFEGTPEGDTHWKKLADFPEGLHPDPKANAVRIILHTADNLFIRPDYVDELIHTYQHDEARLRAYTLGEFASFVRGTAYWEYTESRVRSRSKTWKDPNRTLNLTWDFNISPLAWVCFQKFPVETNYVRRDVFKVHGCSNGTARGLLDAIADFAAQYPVETFGGARIEIDGDVSGNANSWKTDGSDFSNIIQSLKSLGYRNVVMMVPSSNPSVRERLERVNKLIAYDRLQVDTEAQNLHHSLSKTALKPGTFDIEKKPGDQWSHWGDALGYALWRLTQHENLERPTLKRARGANIV